MHLPLPQRLDRCEFCDTPLADRPLVSLTVCDACIPDAAVTLIPWVDDIYVPYLWARSWRTSFDTPYHVAVETLLQGPTSEHRDYAGGDPYWDAWEEVLSSAYCCLPGRTSWTLYEGRGDLLLAHPLWGPDY